MGSERWTRQGADANGVGFVIEAGVIDRVRVDDGSEAAAGGG